MRAKLISALVFLACPVAALAAPYQIVERPRQECWNEQVQVQPRNGAGTLVGGIAGGLLGNQIGSGNGRTIATAVGAVTGAVVGQRLSAPAAPYLQTVQRCRTLVERVALPLYRERPLVLAEPVPAYMPAAGYYMMADAGPRDGYGRGYEHHWHWRRDAHERGHDAWHGAHRDAHHGHD